MTGTVLKFSKSRYRKGQAALASRRSLIESPSHLIMKSDLEELARMLSGLINGLGKNGD
jgi:hypothetical protein